MTGDARHEMTDLPEVEAGPAKMGSAIERPVNLGATPASGIQVARLPLRIRGGSAG